MGRKGVGVTERFTCRERRRSPTVRPAALSLPLSLRSCVSIADFRGIRIWNLNSHVMCLDLPLGAIRCAARSVQTRLHVLRAWLGTAY